MWSLTGTLNTKDWSFVAVESSAKQFHGHVTKISESLFLDNEERIFEINSQSEYFI